MSSPDDLQLAGIIPLLADDVRATPQAELRLHVAGRLVEPGAEIPDVVAAEAVPRVDIDGEGLFTLLAVELDPTSNRQTLQWLVTNIPDYDFVLGHQAVSYAPPSRPGNKHVFLLYRQQADDPINVRVLPLHILQKFDDTAMPTDTASPDERSGFDTKTFATQYGLRLPVAVTWFTVT